MMKRLALVAMSGVISIGFAEFALRQFMVSLPAPVLIYLHRELKDAHPDVYVRLRDLVPNLQRRREDPDVGWTFQRSERRTGVNEDGEPYDRTTTPEGFFSPDVPEASAQQLITIGDSFLSTFVVPRPAAWTLRERIGLPVYNLAVGGWGPESYRAAYEKFAADRAHSLVVVFSFINDISDVENWLAWKANDRGLSFMTWIQSENPDGEGINTGSGWLDRRSVLWNLVRFGMRSRSATTTAAAATPAAVDESPDGSGLQLTEGQVFAVNDPDAFRPGGSYYPYLQAYFESLERLRRSIESRGARMALVWIPSKERVYLPLIPASERRRFVTNSTGDVGGIEPVLSHYAGQAGLPFLDTTDALIDAARQGPRVFFRLDGHLNARGNALLGALAAEFVKAIQSGMWEVPDPPAEVLPYRTGDVALETVLTAADVPFRSPLVRVAGSVLSVRGQADSQFGYVVQWPERDVNRPAFVVAKGQLRAGGFTLGVLRDGAWAATLNVTVTGRFDVALPVMAPGRYQLTIAHALPVGSRETDFVIDQIGWASLLTR